MNTQRRKYEQRKRAEKQEETRLRIVEAAVALHQELGPARTAISHIAELADVGRPTVYRHFPDERAIFQACSGHYRAQHPAPQPEGWRTVKGCEERLQYGLAETYDWYRQTEPMMSKVWRDLPQMPVLREVMNPRFELLAELRLTLLEPWPEPHPSLLSVAIDHALDFQTWRSLAITGGLDDHQIANLMTGMVLATVTQSVDLTEVKRTA